MSIRDRIEALLASPRLPLWAALVAVALCLPALPGGFAADDHGMARLLDHGVPWWDLYDFTRLGSVPELMERGFLGWWASPELSIAFLRPLSSISHAIDFALWPDWPWLMHAHSVLLYALLCGLIAVLYRRLGGSAVAVGAAALLFVVDDVHAQTVGWISGRNAVLAALPAFAALWAHHRWRKDGWTPGPWLASVLLAASVLSAEAGLASAAYLAAYALCMDRGRWWRRLASLAPYAAVLTAWQLAYRFLGYGARGSGLYVDAAADPLTFGIRSIQHAWILVFSQLTLPASSPLAAVPWGWLAAAGGVSLVALALRPLLQCSALARFYAVGMLLAALPFGATVPSDRILLPLGFGASGLLGVLIGATRSGELSGLVPRWTQRGLLLCAGVLSPLLFMPSLYMVHLMEPDIRAIEDALPTQGTAVMVSVPLDILMLYPEAVRRNAGEPWPDHVYTLHAGMDRVEAQRCGPRCLALVPDRGWLPSPLERLARSEDEPFHTGWVQGFDAMTARVTRVTPDGRPEAAAFLFEQPLEQLHLFTWLDGAVAPWTPPPIDQHVTLETRWVPGG